MSRPPREKRVFCNRSLRLDHISWIGFDMDYTLAVYDQAELDRLTIEAALPKLIARGYPESLTTLDYDLSFPVRGLTVDAQLGNVLKMDRHKYVKRAYHGLRELTYDERREHYRATRIRAQGTTRYYFIDTLYALSEVTLFAAGIAHMEALGLSVDYHRWFYDIRETVDLSHQDGTIISRIVAHPERYLTPDPALPAALEALRAGGKKLFLLTNSRPEYTAQIMRFLLEGKLAEHGRWQELFDLVVTAAKKPSFFVDQGVPFRDEHGEPCDALEPGRLYQGGCASELARAAGLQDDRVLYVGDHIYGDVLRAKKHSPWRTAMILPELEQELSAVDRTMQATRRWDALEEKRQLLLETSRLGDAGHEAELWALEAECSQLEQEIERAFHPYWGSLLKAGTESSSFGHQVATYACLYTARVANLSGYSPLHYFRSPRERLPHEV